MRRRSFRSLLAATVLAIGTGATATVALADPGPGTFTRITSPGALIYKFDQAHPTANVFVVTGTTSTDVTSVDIKCFWINGVDGPLSATFATDVAVKNGTFSTAAAFPNFPTTCRLRAVPSSSTDDYVGSYSGPIIRANTFVAQTDGSTAYGYLAITEENDGLALDEDAGTCGAANLISIALPSLTVDTSAGGVGQVCALALPSQNISTTATATGSTIKVDKHNAYLPAGVHQYLNGNLSLGLTQPKLTTTFARTAAGDLTITESATLMRCSVGDTFPPTTTSCPKLISTGVTFKRTTNLFRSAHQIRIRDTFAATTAHSVTVQYVNAAQRPPTGAVGFVIPGHGTTAVGFAPGQTLTGLGTKAATVYVRSDRYASADDPTADTRAITWSKAPGSIQFETPSPTAPPVSFGMAYTLSVPAKGVAALGFAVSERATTTDVKALAATATTEMIIAPKITSPASGATIKGTSTTVKGTVAAGANGLPTAVSVNGHKATLTRTSSTAATWLVTFTQSLAAHTIRVTATDNAGNAAAKSIKVRNVKK